MPLLNENNADVDLKLQEDWFAVRRFLKSQFNKRPDLNAILFLIGMNEVGKTKENWQKEEKQDLMHVAICRLFEPDGFYTETHKDADGWPHFECLKPMPKIDIKKQDGLLKKQITRYFKMKNYI